MPTQRISLRIRHQGKLLSRKGSAVFQHRGSGLLVGCLHDAISAPPKTEHSCGFAAIYGRFRHHPNSVEFDSINFRHRPLRITIHIILNALHLVALLYCALTLILSGIPAHPTTARCRCFCNNSKLSQRRFEYLPRIAADLHDLGVRQGSVLHAGHHIHITASQMKKVIARSAAAAFR